MSGHTLMPYLVAGLMVSVVAGIIILFVLRKLKGSLRIVMARTAFDSGGDIEGQVGVQIRKETLGNVLTVALVASEVTTRFEEKKRTTHTREVYRDQYELEGRRTYAPGHESTHDFKLTIPATNNPDPKFGGAMAAFTRSIGDRQTRIEWAVESRLDAQGVDLVAKKIISVR
ncbi:hypothetical protein DSLASN_10330 [Desulfoluna limicola]|uniref:Uncharacterized protein n=1 Tax=Desulfoluna limicola TaxID=2810562 RepID=A0ABM7PEA9_9BACT|nr:hypothetical protein [Desulfoluna limicola]BCS95401.1 hypothetical protein DSLASN_10330 [Desulfoluna limicola]